MSEFDIKEAIKMYNDEFTNGFEYIGKTNKPKEPLEYRTDEQEFYQTNFLTRDKLSSLINGLKDETNIQENSWSSRVLNESYYNVFSNTSNEFDIIIGNQFNKKIIKIHVSPDGMIYYNDLVKLKDFIGNPLPSMSVEELCILLKKMICFSIDFKQLEKCIKLRQLNCKLVEFVKEHTDNKVKKLMPCVKM